MGKAPDPTTIATMEVKSTEGNYFEAQKTTIASRLPNRRGKWKKVQGSATHSNESFETAESQNIGSQLFNSLYAGASEKSSEAEVREIQPSNDFAAGVLTTTTPMTLTTAANMDDYDLTTPKQNGQITTLPMDELM